MRMVAIIPARGGSKGIPGKNIKILNGKPLIAYAIENAKAVPEITDVVVSTDDEQIAYVSEKYGARVIDRPSYLAEDDVTLDSVIHHAVLFLENCGEKVDVVVTMQPTSPTLSSQSLRTAITEFLRERKETTISVVNDPHLSWGRKGNKIIPLYEKRLNRQQLPPNYKETGAFVITRREFVTEKSRFGNQISVYELPEREAIDIDTKEDWLLCEYRLSQRKILILAEGTKEIGLGHIYRSMLLSSALFEHEVLIVTTERSEIGIRKLKESNLKFDVIKSVDDFPEYALNYNADIVINDILDTTPLFIKKEKKVVARVVNFEDSGAGGEYADAVINALYSKDNNRDNYYCGEKYYCLRDEFVLTNPKKFSTRVENVLICFGGTDPSGYNNRLLEVIEQIDQDEKVSYQFILGIGYECADEFKKKCEESKKNITCISNVSNMAKYMQKADMAVSSQGRTVYELASQRVPTIVLAQNDREYRHEFAFLKNGFINLGNGNSVSNETILETMRWLSHSPQIRKQMYDYMAGKHLEKGIERVKRIIIGEY